MSPKKVRKRIRKAKAAYSAALQGPRRRECGAIPALHDLLVRREAPQTKAKGSQNRLEDTDDVGAPDARR